MEISLLKAHIGICRFVLIERLTVCFYCYCMSHNSEIKADNSPSAWAVHRSCCLVLVQLCFNRKLGLFAFFVVCSLAHFFGIYSPLLKNTHGFASYLPQWYKRGWPSLVFVCQMWYEQGCIFLLRRMFRGLLAIHTLTLSLLCHCITVS